MGIYIIVGMRYALWRLYVFCFLSDNFLDFLGQILGLNKQFPVALTHVHLYSAIRCLSVSTHRVLGQPEMRIHSISLRLQQHCILRCLPRKI